MDRRRFLLASASLGATLKLAPAVSATANERAEIEAGLVPAVVLTNRPKRLLTHVANRMAHYGVPGASVAVLRNGKRAWSAAYGVIAAGRAARIGPHTLFQAASLSKPVTAVAALRLVDAGKITLDEDVNARLRRPIPFADGIVPRPITLRQLLSHTAGVNVPSFPGFDRDAPLPLLNDILDGAPGAKTPRIEVVHGAGEHQYSGGGYEIVEQLIEHFDGAFEMTMERSVLRRAEMQHSTFRPAPPDRLAADVASGHGWTGKPRDPAWLLYPQHAAASLWSTAGDLARFLAAVVASHRNARGALLTQATARQMLTLVAANTGLGFGVEGEGRAKLISHAGWNTGYRSYMAAFPETGDGIVVMTNGDRGHQLAMEIVRAAARAYEWPAFAPDYMPAATVSADLLDQLAGTYEFAEAGFQVVLSREDDHLRLSAPRGDYILHAIADASSADDTQFVAMEDGERAAFKRSESDTALQIWDMRARRVSG